MTYITTFTVRAGVRFPLDMLRYDSCHPYSEQDAALIDRTMDPQTRIADRKRGDPKPIKLAHIGNARTWQPTHARWSSFLWSVDPESVETRQL